jgi:excinuclease ABC subunit B
MHNNSPEQMPDTGRSVDALRSHLKLEGGKRFVMHSEFEPAGDQPTAIAELAQGIAIWTRTRCCWARPAPARPSPWPR